MTDVAFDSNKKEPLLGEGLQVKDGPSQCPEAKALRMEEIFKNNYNDPDRPSQHFFESNYQTPENLAKRLGVDLTRGLDDSNPDALKERARKFGSNAFPPEEPNLIWDHIKECFNDKTLQILAVASIVSLTIGILKDGIKTGWIEGTAIFFTVTIVVSITSYMNYNEKEQFLKLSRESKKKQCVVKRNGAEKPISVEDVLVGDIVKIRIGDILCCDGICFGNSKADLDESPVTGESELMKKSAEFIDQGKKYTCPFMFSESLVKDGSGYFLCAAVGDYSFQGRNRQLTNSQSANAEDDMTPLQKQLNELADLIGNFGFCMAILIGSAIILKETIIMLYNGKSLLSMEYLDGFVTAFILAVTVLCVAIPEGLPMAVTISLAYSVNKMKEEKNLVKHLDKSETMGNVNNVCTDKTGTLTLGEMQIVKLYLDKNDYDVKEKSPLSEEQTKLVRLTMWKNITATGTMEERVVNGEKRTDLVVTGDMTESAIYKWLYKNKLIDENENRQGKYILPFKSEYKYMMNIYEDGNGGYILYIKGGPDFVERFFGKFRGQGGVEEEYDEAAHNAFLNQMNTYASKAIRTLAFGYKELSDKELKEGLAIDPTGASLDFFNKLAEGATFAFMIGIRDDNREDVPLSVTKCHKAGIMVRMVTGDNIKTAVAISESVHILEPNEVEPALRIQEQYTERLKGVKDEDSLVKNHEGIKDLPSPLALEGKQFEIACGGLTKTQRTENKKTITEISLNKEDAFQHITKNLKVIARASPENKFLLVFGLKHFGNIVAVTGDGTNDAPALKQAHVGFAMGIRGTDIAKDAADIVLLNDSFSSIVTACKYGRNIYDCIRKFVQFQLTTNVSAVFMALLGGILLHDSPLNAIQMLWVNLIMDSFASLALATESPTDELLNRKPYKRGSDIITPFMMANIISQGIFQIVVLTILIFYGDILFGVPSDRELDHFTWNDVNGYHFTIFFNTFVFMQVINSINARKLRKSEKNIFKGIFDNKLYLIIQGIIILGQMALVTVGGRAVRTHPLSVKQHCYCLCIALLTLIVGFLVKLLPIDLDEKGDGEEKKESRTDNIISQTARRGSKALHTGGQMSKQ